MLDVRFRSLPQWTRSPGLRQRKAQFKTRYDRTLDKLEHEIRQLAGQAITIEAGYSQADIRNDGWPKAGSRPKHPGAVLYFESRGESLCFPSGTYKRLEDNIHAIALTLECLRAVDRYGVTSGREQYRGFLALPAPGHSMTVEEAAEFITRSAGIAEPAGHVRSILNAEDIFSDMYRMAAKRLHPDRSMGNLEDWHKLQAAEAVLKAHHAAS